jgi:chemotaxis protein CheX
MATGFTEVMDSISADPVILNAIVGAVESCLTMCDTEAKCVGVNSVPTKDPGTVTGIIGVHGDVSGFITVNMAEKVAMSAVGGLLQDDFDTLTHQVVDGVGEITNIISGGVKNGLSGTAWGFSHVTVPSIIVGQNYQIAYAKGLQFLSVTFEQENVEAVMLDDRLIQVAVSLIRL